MIKLYAVWTLLYIPIRIWNVVQSSNKIVSVLTLLQETLFSGSYFHLWFLPALIMGLLFFSVMKRGVKNIYIQALICISLFIIGIIGDSWHGVIEETTLEIIYDSYRNIFVTTRNGLFFAPIFIWIGYDMAEKRKSGYIIKNQFLWLLAVLTIFIATIECYLTGNNTVNNMMIYTIAASYVVLWITTKPSKSENNIFIMLRRMSTLIFCGHPWVMIIISHTPLIGYSSTLNTIVVILLTTIIAFAVELCSRKVRWLNGLKILY